MKKELLNCINNNIIRTRKAQESHERKTKIIEENQKLIDTFWRDYYMRQIHDFFRGYHPDRGLTFPLYNRRQMTNEEYNDLDRHLIIHTDFSYDYDPIVDVMIPEFKGIGFSELQIGYDTQENELYIKGLVLGHRYYMRHDYWDSIGMLVDYQRWSIHSLEVFVLALPWIEKYIAKEFGCSPPP